MDNGFIFLVLLPASLFDLSRYRIPNALLVSGLIYSLIWHLELQGLNSVSPWLAGMVIPLLLYYVLFRLHVFGASDGKLMAVVGSYVGLSGVFTVLYFSLIVGAVMSLGKLLLGRNLHARFSYMCNYARRVAMHEDPGSYYVRTRDGTAGVIPFGVAIGIGAVVYLCIGGV